MLLVIVIESKILACPLSTALVLLNDSFRNGQHQTELVGYILWTSRGPSRVSNGSAAFPPSSKGCLTIFPFFPFYMPLV